MKFCLGESEIDESIHTIVSGPWDSCLECETFPSSSSSSGECGFCRVQQETCGCWKTSIGGGVSVGIPKHLTVSVESQQKICVPLGTDETSSPCYVDPSYVFIGSECKLSGDRTDCKTTLVDASPSIEISGNLQVWSSDGCDASGNPINPVWGSGSLDMKISGDCGQGDSNYSLPVAFSPSGFSIGSGGAEFRVCGGQGDSFFQAAGAGSGWGTRERREYGDFTFDEEQTVDFSFGSFSVRLKLSSTPTCRAPDTGQFCTCLDETYNVVGLGELPTYRADPGKCAGNPIDIDVICGVPSREDAGGNDPGMYSVYYTPYSNTVVVIGGVVYDTTKMPEPPPGKTNVLLVYVGGSRNDVREWTCKNLKYATIRDLSKWPGMGSSSTSSGGVIDVTNNLDFNWPYNDLYFSQGCPGGDSVNLVPC